MSSEGCNPVHTHPSEASFFLQVQSTNTYRNVKGQDSSVHIKTLPSIPTGHLVKLIRSPSQENLKSRGNKWIMHIETAVLNNILWCGIVCDLHGLTQTSNEYVWGLLSKAPEFYPDIITTSKHATNEEVKDFAGKREVFSIKDSFAKPSCMD